MVNMQGYKRVDGDCKHRDKTVRNQKVFLKIKNTVNETKDAYNDISNFTRGLMCFQKAM